VQAPAGAAADGSQRWLALVRLFWMEMVKFGRLRSLAGAHYRFDKHGVASLRRPCGKAFPASEDANF
jgi:hypothetical protein